MHPSSLNKQIGISFARAMVIALNEVEDVHQIKPDTKGFSDIWTAGRMSAQTDVLLASKKQ